MFDTDLAVCPVELVRENMGHKVPHDGEGTILGLLRAVKNAPPSAGGVRTPVNDNAGVSRASLKWCTIECEHAEWPEENVDGSGSCRTFSALRCRLLNEHVTKNSPCAAEFGQRRPKPNW